MPVLQRIGPHVLAYVIMAMAAFLLFRPYMFEGKVLAQPDNQRARAMQTEMMAYQAKDGHTPLWTNTMFSGMPTYMIRHTAFGSLYFHAMMASLWWQEITLPHFVILLAMLMAYLALLVMRLDWRIALLGGISYGISTYYVDLAEAGHSTKMLAMAYTPAIWASALLVLRRHWLLGSGLFALFTSLQILASHLQITYYTFLILAIGMLIYGVRAFREKNIRSYLLALGMLALGFGVSLASNLSLLWPSYEYSKETIRGGSDLRAKAETGDGLDKDYAFSWSYGIGESMTLLIPNYMGGGASQTFRNTETYRRVYPNVLNNLVQQGYPRAQAARSAEQQVASLFYHGGQPFVGVAIYFGAALIFLFVLGALLVSGPLRWWLLTGALFALMVSWGKNFFVNELLFDYFPFFNKFRAVSMALGLSHLCVVLLGMLGLQELFTSQDPRRALKALYRAGIITGGLALLGLLAGQAMNLVGSNDSQMGPELAAMLQSDRLSLLRTDALRSLLIIALCFGILWAFLNGKLRAMPALALVALIAVADVWLVDSRILFAEKYEPAREANTPPPPTEADEIILQDPDLHFRVLDLRGNPFTNANTSFYHKSLGGYHAAKLMRYQELIETYLSNPGENTDILGMLNTKYIIQNREGVQLAIPTREGYGNAWFVQKLVAVADADAELAALKKITLRSDAVVQPDYLPDGWLPEYDVQVGSFVRLDKYHPDTMTYTYSNPNEGFIVFSEIYYPPAKGWKMYLDGQPYEDFTKVNYLLRGLKVPPGENRKLEMIFHPESVYTGKKVALAGSLLGILLLLGGIFHTFRQGRWPDFVRLPGGEANRATSKAPVKRGRS
jgi:hypothetical protein